MSAATEQRRQLIALASGGTGGHMFPAAALAHVLLARGHRVALITDKRGGGFGSDLAAVETYRVNAGGILGGSLVAKAQSVLRLGYGFLQAGRLLKRLAPDRVVAFGGYASVPAGLAAARLGLPLVLHEQNAVMGRANRLLAGRAGTIATSFAKVAALSEEQAGRAVFTGNPVREAVSAIGRRPYALPGSGEPLRLLVTGGSQGARAFDETVPAAVAALPAEIRARLEVSQQVRERDPAAVQADYRKAGVTAELAPFFQDLPERLARAHLVICRSGASTVAELAAAGRPAVLVPYPYAADDHQTANAEAFAEAGGGWPLPQGELEAGRLAARLADLLGNPSLLARAAGCALAQGRPDAAEHLASLALGEQGRNGNGAHGTQEVQAA